MSEEEKMKIAVDLAKQGIDLEEVERIAFIGEIICIIAILISLTIITIVKDERKTQIKILEQSLNEQIQEKQVYMNMLEEERSK
jgi:hypothetical protein